MFRRSIPSLFVSLLVLFWTSPMLAEAPSKAEVEAYLGKMTKSHEELNKHGQDFGRLLGPALKGGAEEKLALYRNYRGMAQLLFKVQQQCNEWKVPEGAASQNMKAANDRFMIYQHEAVLDKVPALLEIVDDDTLDGDAKLEKIRARITLDNAREIELGKQVRSAMEALREAAK